MSVTWVWCRVNGNRIQDITDFNQNPQYLRKKFRVIGSISRRVTILVEDSSLDSWVVRDSHCRDIGIDSIWKGKNAWNVEFGAYLPAKGGGCLSCRPLKRLKRS